MEVCCIVIDIDEMLFEFFRDFLNIEKKKLFPGGGGGEV